MFDFAEHAGAPYFVMEFLDGGTLAQRLAGQPQAPAEAARLVEVLSRAVHAAHRCGVVHRDLKPSNVLLSGDGTLKITDFGLAKLLAGDTHLTQAGMALGTPCYMAPEQAGDPEHPVGPAADVYALGTLPYECLTGRPPFGGKSPAAVLSRVLHERPTAPSRSQPRAPPDLDSICLQCLAKDPAQRYLSAEALAEDLRAFQSGAAPAAPRRPSRTARRWALALGCLGLCVTLSLLAAHALSPGAPAPGPTPAVPPRPALAGDLHIDVWAGGRHGKPGLRVGRDRGALPVRNGEQVQLVVELSRPAYVYLLWLDARGTADPLFPWQRAFDRLPASQGPQSSVRSPPERDRGWPVEGPSGLETALLLARDTPLPPEFDLVALLGPGAPAPLRDPQEVAVRGFDEGAAGALLNLEQHRGLGKEAQQIDTPLERLLERLRPHFTLARAVRFAHAGD